MSTNVKVTLGPSVKISIVRNRLGIPVLSFLECLFIGLLFGKIPAWLGLSCAFMVCYGTFYMLRRLFRLNEGMDDPLPDTIDKMGPILPDTHPNPKLRGKRLGRLNMDFVAEAQQRALDIYNMRVGFGIACLGTMLWALVAFL